ncbi:AHH domain-containing protein [Myxococcus sp. CA040A]|uniref:AHH domain-containing protein n=1 Tax=Myxococcus sp. CA040A TaxID=2741738 RepID=UPI00157A67B7|nr:AHH domain-containing protein [Myxococcus sp. CA040A]NTX02576.1 AHH domain-containing protein [Myxococcus sp. CA040A]
MDDKHIERLTKNSDYHKNGACVVRHAAAQNAECKYARNGYNVTLRARQSYYNNPRYTPAEVTGVRTKSISLAQPDGTTRAFITPKQQQANQPVDPHIWDIGHHGNFVPLYDNGEGGHHPYKHNWHHLIANDMLFQELFDDSRSDPYQLLELLMVAGYNLNGERNIVLLPKWKEVGELIDWPIHPNNHPGFDEFAKEKLNWLKDQLDKALGDQEVHKVDPKSVQSLKDDLETISDNLFLVLEKMPGGVHINKIKKLGAALEAELRQQGRLK